MKLVKDTFDNYLNNYVNIHNNSILNSINNIDDFTNLIIYGKEGIGKYSETLNFIKKFSNSLLKYEKKIVINNNKNDLYIKISDIHYEIDIQLLGYNAKSLFNEIYNLIVDIISAKKNKVGIILCKNFDFIDTELLDIFYSYMRNNFKKVYCIKFILITCNYSFIPNNILNINKLVSLKEPAKYNLKKICTTNNIINKKNIDKLEIKNLKDRIFLKNIDYNDEYLYNIYYVIINNKINFNKLRNDLYDLLIYKIDINNFIWKIIELLILNNKININNIDNILLKTFNFFLYYNNNYRPIFHLENYIIYLVKIVNEF